MLLVFGEQCRFYKVIIQKIGIVLKIIGWIFVWLELCVLYYDRDCKPLVIDVSCCSLLFSHFLIFDK